MELKPSGQQRKGVLMGCAAWYSECADCRSQLNLRVHQLQALTIVLYFLCFVGCVQVDVDMADNSRSPLTVNQQLLMLGSPPLGSTAAVAAAGAAAIMGFGPTHAGAAAAGMTAGSLHQQQQQQQPGQPQGAFPGSSVFRQQEQQK